ncbi:MAG TPA: hypothetical protein VN363_06665 [Anaerolineales bacterium]|nr:hypothetical protein [Anaerolineales bacterium]
MKLLFTVLLVTLLTSVWITGPALADHGDQMGNCPPVFELHHFTDHSGEHMHQHIGLDQDLNSDGWICMQMLPNDLHLHVDNNLPF